MELSSARIAHRHSAVILITFMIVALLIIPVNGSPLQLSILTNQEVYNVGEEIVLNGLLHSSGSPIADGLVAVQVNEPHDDLCIIRTKATGSNVTEPWLMEIIEFFPANEYGYPQKSFARGGMVGFKVSIRNNDFLDHSYMVTANGFYSNQVPFFAEIMISSTISGNTTQTTQIYSLVTIPSNAPLGNASIYASILSDFPERGGYAYGPEAATSLTITDGGSSSSLSTTSQERQADSNEGTFTINFRTPEMYAKLGNYAVHATSFYPITPFMVQFSITFEVILRSDITGPEGIPDGRVDIRDVALVAQSFGTYPGHPRWNPIADINEDEKIDIRDIAIVAKDYGKIVILPPSSSTEKIDTPSNILFVDDEACINTFEELPQPYLAVMPNQTVLGPELVVGKQFGKEFQVRVNVMNLHVAWFLVRVQFQLSYDPEFVEFVSVTEGEYLSSYAIFGTSPSASIWSDRPYGRSISFSDVILPDKEGKWNFTLPGGDPPEDGTLAVITFRPLKQSWTQNFTSAFNITEMFLEGKEANIILHAPPRNGSYTMLQVAPTKRRIDVWMESPPRHGGQGISEPADLVIPQTDITLQAKVTYNWSPVEGKIVTFEIRDNNGSLVGLLSDVTDINGHAYAYYRMPWPGENFFGVWNIIVSVNIGGEVVSDYMEFHYDYCVRTWDISTDKFDYAHVDTVKITVDYGTYAQLEQTAYLVVSMVDELGVPLGFMVTELKIGGAEYYIYRNYTTTAYINIPKWAFAGWAIVSVSFLDAPPYEGGTSLTPQATTIIVIQPY